DADSGDKLSGSIAGQLAKPLVRKQLALVQLLHLARIDNDVRLEVKDLFQFAQRNVEQVADARRQTLEEPHVRTRAGQIDMAETLAAHLRLGDFDAALVADHTAVLHALVLAAETLPIGHRPKDARAEQSVALRFEGAVVNRLGLGHFAVRPLTNLFRRSQRDANRLKVR